MRFVVYDSKRTYSRRIGARKVKMKKGEFEKFLDNAAIDPLAQANAFAACSRLSSRRSRSIFRLTGNGSSGIANGYCRRTAGSLLFGTTSEANSMSTDERISLLDALVAAGIDPSRMMPGTGCCSITETVELTAHAVKHGCAGVLMLPPFYYKDVSEEGLYRYFSEVVQRVGDARLRIYLYHIPPVAIVGITPKLVERLLKAYPNAIAGMKDSSGDWNNTKTFLDAFAESARPARTGFDVFVGSESFLLANMRNGGAGTISATANVNPAAIHELTL